MKKIILLIIITLLSCSKKEDDSINLQAREDMRHFVESLSKWSRTIDSDFIVIPQNGHELFTINGEPDGTVATEYLNAISAMGQEDLYYGYNNDNEATPTEDIKWLEGFLDIGKNRDIVPLVTNYCSDISKMTDAYNRSDAKGYISYSADHRELDNIATFPIHNENNNSINTIFDIKNFLYLLNPSNFISKEQYISALEETNYDMFIIDLYFNDSTKLTSDDLSRLKKKPSGNPRIVVSYMSIGEAEDYRYYWNKDWKVGNPSWIKYENPNWKGNYQIEYWNNDWQNIIFGNDSSYLKLILDTGFDGVYLDIIEGFEAFE